MHILWLKTELLHPVDKGGRIRTYNMLRALRRAHHVTYVTLDDGQSGAEEIALAGEYCDDLVRIPFRAPPKGTLAFYADLLRNVASPLPYAIARYRSGEMRRVVDEIVSRGGVDVAVCDFLTTSINVPERLACPVVLFQHNVEALIWARRAAVAGNRVSRAYLGLQWRRMRRFEERQCRHFERVVAVSETDAAAMRREYGVSVVEPVPTGVDTAYFHMCAQAPSDPYGLVFTGSMDWLPNEDAVIHFAREILPKVRARIPDCTFTIVGREPPPRVRALGEHDPAIRVVGRVHDVRPYLERAALAIVPMRLGGGTRLKVYEAMAMGKAVVSTSIGAEGLHVTHQRDIVLADSPDAFAAAVVRLLDDRSAATSIGARAAAHVRAHYSWEHVANDFAEICDRAVSANRAPAGIGS